MCLQEDESDKKDKSTPSMSEDWIGMTSMSSSSQCLVHGDIRYSSHFLTSCVALEIGILLTTRALPKVMS